MKIKIITFYPSLLFISWLVLNLLLFQSCPHSYSAHPVKPLSQIKLSFAESAIYVCFTMRILQ